MQHDLLHEIEQYRDISHIVILTHNIDFLFLEMMVLPVIAQCGHPTITIFADAACATEAFTRQERYLRESGLGRRYRVVRVPMPQGGRFHPKAILLMGAAEGHLYVGSGNLTLGGWRENAEIWRHFTHHEGSGAFMAFHTFLREIITALPLHEELDALSAEIYDGRQHRWLDITAPPAHLVGHHQGGETLIAKMISHLGGMPVHRLHICAPYFDEGAVAVNTLVQQMQAKETHVYTQAPRTNLYRAARRRFPKSVTLHQVEAIRSGGAQPFVHAKFIACEGEDRVRVFCGSANCSVAALMHGGNSELYAIDDLSKVVFDAQWFNDITVGGEPTLADAGEGETRDDIGRLTIQAAHLNAGILTIAYAPITAQIRYCRLDRQLIPVETPQPGVAEVVVKGLPRVVTLLDVDGNESAPCWVDAESHLNSSAPQRLLASSINHALRPGNWGISAWVDVVGKLCKYIEYRRVMPLRAKRPNDENAATIITFRREDVFLDTTHPFAFAAVQLSRSSDDNILSLRGLLLSLFGYEMETPVRVQTTVQTPDDKEPPDIEGADAEDATKQLAVIPTPSPAAVLQQCNERDRRLADDLAKKIVELLTNDDYLAQRPPELLSSDVSMTAMLLLEAHKRQWISDDLFFTITYQIWCRLFLQHGETGAPGWIGAHFPDGEERLSFISRLRSPLLTASLLGWVLLTPERDTVDYYRFILAALLAMIRYPLIWSVSDEERPSVQRQLEQLVAEDAGVESAAGVIHTVEIQQRYDRLVALVQQFAHIDAMLLTDHTLHPIETAQAGELVYNIRLGYCMVIGADQENPNYHLAVCLQDENGSPRKFTMKGYFYGVEGQLTLHSALACKEEHSAIPVG